MKRLRKVILIISGSFLFLMILAWVLSYVYEDQIKKVIVESINKNLITPVGVKDIQFSLIRKFPYATLEFIDVKINGSVSNEGNRPLLQAHKLNLNFSIWDVFGDHVTLKKIEISDATAFIYINKAGEGNFEIWKKDDKTTNSSFRLNMQEVLLNDVNVFYLNNAVNHDYAAMVEKGKLVGNFSKSEYDLDVKSKMLIHHFMTDGVNYIKEKETAVDFSLHVNTIRNLYTINNAEIQLAELVLVTSGSIERLQDGNLLNIKVGSKNASLKELLSLAPAENTKRIDQFDFDGKVDFTATIKGVSSKTKTPLIKADFSSANSTIRPSESDHVLRNIRFNGIYTNRKSDRNAVSYVSFTNVRATLDQQPLSGSLLIENLSSPWISCDASGTIDLKTLNAFYKPDTIAEMSGLARVNVKVNGRPDNVSGFVSSGSIALQDVSFSIKGKAAVFEAFNGLFTLDGDKFKIQDLKGIAAGSDFNINGSIENLFSFLLKENQVLLGSARLTSRNLDLNELLEDKSKTKRNDTAYYLDISERIKIKLALDIGVMSFQKFQAWNVKGNISVQNKILSTSDLSLKSMNGRLNLSGTIDAAQKNNILISGKANVIGIDITQLFYEMGNFGQDVINDKNLKGVLTAQVQFAGVWSKTLNCDLDKIYAKSDFTIEQGELIKFEPMQALSKYMKGVDWQHITFSTLKNSIEIKQQKIYIPSMEIKSSALEMTASGTHTFDNIVDYRLGLLLSQITGKKVKQLNTEFGTIEDDGLGRTKIFLSMKGPMKDPRIKYDSEGTEEKIVNDVKKEKQNIKTVLNKEFGWFKKDSAAVKITKTDRKKPELQIDKDDEE